MNLTYFYNCTSLEDAKKLYRSKVKEFHPDVNKGIDESLIKQLNEQWEYINSNIITYPIYSSEHKIRQQEFNLRNNPSKEERHQVIKALQKIQIVKGYKPVWVYYQYIEECKQRNIKLTRWDIELIAEYIGYKDGWVYHKCLELKI